MTASDSIVRILHLEDNELDAELIQTSLENEGLSARWQRVHKREDFLMALEAGEIDLILADYVLPAFDGLTALNLAHTHRPEVPFIFVSGALGEERAIEALKQGATDYVLKTHLNRLASSVQRALREAQERTERQRAQAEVYAEREWLRTTLASIGDAVIATDTQGQVTFMNTVAQVLTGWPEAEAVGQPITQVFTVVDETTQSVLESPVARVLRERTIVGLNDRTALLSRTGAVITIDDSGAPIHDQQGQLIGVVLVFRDTRERRRAEALLRESEERYRALVAATTTLVWVTDATGEISQRLPAWEEYTGQRWPAYRGSGWLEMNHPDDRDMLEANWAESVAQRAGYHQQGRLWHAASGEYRYYVSYGVPMFDAEGRVREWIGAITDIHESKLAQKHMEEAAERTARSQAIIAALAQALTPAEVVDTIVSHGTILVEAIAGAVNLLTEDGTALELVQSRGYTEERLAPWHRFPLTAAVLATQVVKSRQAVWLPSWAAYAVLYPERAERMAGPRYEAQAVIPLLFEDRVLGTLSFSFTAERNFSEAERNTMLSLARQCALALERARLFEAEQRARAEAQALNVTLEARVQERTKQLEMVLFDLRIMNDELNKEIAERRQGEERIRQSERRLAETQHLAGLGGWYWDVVTDAVSWSEQMYHIYGLTPETFPGTFEAFLEQVHPEDRDRVAEAVMHARDTLSAFSLDHRILLPDGQVRTIHAQGEVILDGQGRLTAMNGTGQDITERKADEEELRASREQLRQFSGYLQEAREEESTRISREIHDQFGGALTALKMDIRQFQKNLKESGIDAAAQTRMQARLDSMADLIDSSAKTIRKIAADLRPSVLDDLGLEAAIEWQLQEFQGRSGIRCDLILRTNEATLDRNGSTALFRVFQETLTNVARHAQASRVDVSLAEQNDYLVLRVHDNGRGITSEELSGNHSLGLVGMRERLGLLAGDLNIQGKPGNGTTVLARIPLRRAQPESLGLQ